MAAYEVKEFSITVDHKAYARLLHDVNDSMGNRYIPGGFTGDSFDVNVSGVLVHVIKNKEVDFFTATSNPWMRIDETERLEAFQRKFNQGLADMRKAMKAFKIPEKQVIGFKNNAGIVEYELCKYCDDRSYKFISVIPNYKHTDGKMIHSVFEGVEKGIEKGLTPIYREDFMSIEEYNKRSGL